MEKEMTKGRAAALLVVDAVGDAIREAGPNGIPSGHLYAMLMGKVSIESYGQIIGILKTLGRVKESGHLLTYVHDRVVA